MLSNGDEGSSQNNEDGDSSFKKKYRELKKRLKYLIYENECFENDIKESRMKLLQMSREKSYLLDQLMVHETVILSDNSDLDSTDCSSDENKSTSTAHTEVTSKKSSLPSAAKLAPPTPSSGPVTSSPKQPATTKGGRAPVAKKPRGTGKQTGSKASTAKNTSKTSTATTSAPVTTATPTLIVSLPINVGQTQPHPPKLISSVHTKNTTQRDKKPPPPSIGGKDKGGVVIKRPSPPSPDSSSSSSTSSSSDSSSDDDSRPGGVSSDSGSDSEGEPMDITGSIGGKPLPPPLLMDPIVTATAMPHLTKPSHSPIRIMPPNKLTSSSLSTIPLLSPSTSPSAKHSHTIGTKSTTPTVSMTTPLTTPFPKSTSLVAGVGDNPVGIGAYHIGKQHEGMVSSTDNNLNTNSNNNRWF